MNAKQRWLQYLSTEPSSKIRDDFICIGRRFGTAVDCYGDLQTYLRANTKHGITVVSAITCYMGELEREMDK